jgi:hypothetical protein
LGCKNSTFRGVDANDFWEKYGGDVYLLRRMTASRMTLRDDHFVDDAPRSGHPACWSSFEEGHHSQSVIHEVVIRNGHHNFVVSSRCCIIAS